MAGQGESIEHQDEDVPDYDQCPNCQHQLVDVDASVFSSLTGSVVDGKLTAEVNEEELWWCTCGKCGYNVKEQVKEWVYVIKGKEVMLGL